MGKKNKKNLKIRLIIALVVTVLIACTYFFKTPIENALNASTATTASLEKMSKASLVVHYIDVGQGDSILIQLPDGKFMLIDATTGKKEQNVITYLDTLGVTTIDYLVLTHSDEDHVGGMDVVLEKYICKQIYRPFQISKDSSYAVTDPLDSYADTEGLNVSNVSTVAYAKFIKAIYEEKIDNDTYASVTVSYDGIVIENTVAGYKFEFFSPAIYEGYEELPIGGDVNKGYPTMKYTDVNNYSPFILLEYSGKTFAFTGDLEKEGEEDLIESVTVNDSDSEDVKVRKNAERARISNTDVLKVGHHGSRTSTSSTFLDLVDPEYAVISSGEGNTYGHPHNETIERLINYWNNKIGSSSGKLFRTDQRGDIMFGVLVEDATIYLYYHTFNLESDIKNNRIYWWQMALGVWVVCMGIIFSIKMKKSYSKY